MTEKKPRLTKAQKKVVDLMLDGYVLTKYNDGCYVRHPRSKLQPLVEISEKVAASTFLSLVFWGVLILDFVEDGIPTYKLDESKL